jgi:hypothetical protein
MQQDTARWPAIRSFLPTRLSRLAFNGNSTARHLPGAAAGYDHLNNCPYNICVNEACPFYSAAPRQQGRQAAISTPSAETLESDSGPGDIFVDLMTVDQPGRRSPDHPPAALTIRGGEPEPQLQTA